MVKEQEVIEVIEKSLDKLIKVLTPKAPIKLQVKWETVFRKEVLRLYKHFFGKVENKKWLDVIFRDAQKYVDKSKMRTPKGDGKKGYKFISDLIENENVAFGNFDSFELQMNNVAKESYNYGGQTTLRSLRISGVFDLRRPEVLNQIKKRQNLMTKDITKNQFEEIKNVLATEFYEYGKNPIEVARTLKQFVNETYKNRARAIARMEINTFQSQATVKTFKENGIERHQWITDASPCPECDAISNMIVNVGDEFVSGITAPPYHVYCECGLSAVIPRDFDPETVWRGGDYEEE